jgi:hypothetical protein
MDREGFLVLKAPQIGGQIAAFADVFPEANFVIADRDPFRCLVSMVVMGESIITPFCIDNPLTNDGARDRVALSWIKPKLTALSAFRVAAPERVTHVAYPELMPDPTRTATHTPHRNRKVGLARGRASVTWTRRSAKLHGRVRRVQASGAAPNAELKRSHQITTLSYFDRSVPAGIS